MRADTDGESFPSEGNDPVGVVSRERYDGSEGSTPQIRDLDCRDCGEPILLGRSLASRFVAVEPDPDPAGDWVLLDSGYLSHVPDHERLTVMGYSTIKGCERFLGHICPPSEEEREKAEAKARRRRLLREAQDRSRREREAREAQLVLIEKEPA